MKANILCKGLLVALGIQGLVTTALARPKLKVALPDGYRGYAGAKRLPHSQTWLGPLTDRSSVRDSFAAAILTERMGNAAIASGQDHMVLKIVEDTAEAPARPRIDEFDYKGELVYGIVGGGHGFRSLGGRRAVITTLVGLAALLSETDGENGDPAHMLFAEGQLVLGSDEVGMAQMGFFEGWAHFQMAHVSRSIRRPLYTPLDRVDVGDGEGTYEPASEQTLHDLIRVPHVVGGILIELEKLAPHERGILRAMRGAREVQDDGDIHLGSFLKAYLDLHPRLRSEVERIVRKHTSDVGSDEEIEQLLGGSADPEATEAAVPAEEVAPVAESGAGDEPLPGGVFGL